MDARETRDTLARTIKDASFRLEWEDAESALTYYRVAAQLRQLADRADKLAAIYDTPTPDQ